MAHEALIETGRYRARLAADDADVRRALALRTQAFRKGQALDRDAFDARCRHVLVETVGSGELVGSYRLLTLRDGREIGESYAAQYYDLGALHAFDAPMIEVGRFCLAPDVADGDVLRVAWAALTRLVDRERIGMLFGCSSFPGTAVADHADALALLAARHVAPAKWRPCEKAPEVVRFAQDIPPNADPKLGPRHLPSLLRTYLLMGGWVSDHAVIDRDLGTLHVFTGLEIDAVPAGRARALRALAGEGAAAVAS